MRVVGRVGLHGRQAGTRATEVIVHQRLEVVRHAVTEGNVGRDGVVQHDAVTGDLDGATQERHTLLRQALEADGVAERSHAGRLRDGPLPHRRVRKLRRRHVVEPGVEEPGDHVATPIAAPQPARSPPA